MNTFLLSLIGIVFILIMARLIQSPVLEIMFFGGVFTLVEAYKFWIMPLGFPSIPEWLTIIFATAITFWAVLRVLYVLGILFFAPLGAIVQLILGGDYHE